MSDTTPRSATPALRRIRTAPGHLSDWQPLPPHLTTDTAQPPVRAQDTTSASAQAEQERGAPCA
jgi:hypothetical protein